MADLTQLLEQTQEEAAALAGEVARAQETVDRVMRLAIALGDGVDSGVGEARSRLEELAGRLGEAEQELAKEHAGAVAGLQSLQASCEDLHGQAGSLLSQVREQLTALRAEKERVREDVERRGEAARSSVERYADQVKGLQGAAESRLGVAQQALSGLLERAETMRGALEQRREAVLAAMQALGETAHARLEGVLGDYDDLAAAVSEQLGDLQATLHSLNEQLAASVERRLRDEALDALAAAASPLRRAIEELERFSHGEAKGHDEKLAEVVEHVQDLTRALEGVRPFLETVSRYLR